ncbi:MAG TPA: RecQ family zinc-binding domain-containing protein, partial [Mucilaginibacter sp.]
LFIKTLLRSYGGAFENYVRLREFDIARRTNMSVQQVIEGLKQLQAYNILSYFPQNDNPQVTYIKPRQHANNVYINKVYIEQRKGTYLRKMEAVFAYAVHKKCRSQMLLAYFDEPNAGKCGICDVCLDEKRRNNAAEIGDTIINEIVEALSIAPSDIGALISSIKTGVEKEKINTIRLLLDAGKIKFNGEKYYL